MAITLEDPATVPNKILQVANDTADVLEITGNIQGTVQTDYLTVGSRVTLQSDGATWWITGLYYRPVLLTSNMVAPVSVGGTETNLNTPVKPVAEGLWIVTGGYKMAHLLGNNQPATGELVFRNTTQGNVEIDRIFWGVGRTSSDADFFVTIASQINVPGPNLAVDDTVDVYAINTGSGTLDVETPSGLEYSGPF